MVTVTSPSPVPRSSIRGHIHNLSVAHKIGLVFWGLLLSTALVAVALLWQLQRVDQQVVQATAHSEQRMLWAVRWQALTNQALEVALAGVQSSEEALIARANAKALTLWNAADEARIQVVQRIASAQDRALMQAAGAQQDQLLQHYKAAFMARDLGQAWEVHRLLEQSLQPVAQAQVALFERLIDQQEIQRNAAVAAGMQQRQAAMGWAVAIYGGLLVLGILVSGALVRSLTRPLQQAVSVARTIAQGDLRVQVDSQRTDEVGVLLHDLGRMAAQLQMVVAQVHGGVGTVNEAAQAIAVGNGELAQRTAHTAAHLRQSVERIEEVTLTLMQTAQTAQEADRLSATAAASAREGGAAVRDVVDSMQGIAERSREIAAITGVIDGIAFQTNILALNAAVEAARAGPQGRGFAVVATEVRALAQRSADAAKQIKTLIADSLRQVDGGVVLARQAGERMHGIVGGVAQVGQLIAEMAQASTAQRDGISHIHSAVLKLEDMTRQNADMVQSCSQATDTMQREVAQLAQEVGVFRLAQDVDAAGTPVRLQRIPPLLVAA